MGITDIFKSQEQKDREAKRAAMRKALEERTKKTRYGNTGAGQGTTTDENNKAADES